MKWEVILAAGGRPKSAKIEFMMEHRGRESDINNFLGDFLGKFIARYNAMLAYVLTFTYF